MALATAWAFFSGPTRYVSLAASAFYGLGAYCVAVLAKDFSYPVALLAAVAFSVVVSALVGLATLRLSGMYFVIFTFGLASLVGAAVTWWDYNVAKSSGWYPDLPFTETHVYYQLLVLCAVVIGLWLVRDRTRMGMALKTLGADETVARQIGINTVALKIGTFVVSSVVMTLAGAIVNSRSYQVTAEYVFNPEISFITVIAALLGGATSAWGPMLGAVPLLLLKEYLLHQPFELLQRAPRRHPAGRGVRHPERPDRPPQVRQGRNRDPQAGRPPRCPRSPPARRGATRAAGAPAAACVRQRRRRAARLAISARPACAKGLGVSPSPRPLLEVKSLSRHFGGLAAVDGVSFVVERGEVLGLVGPNGSGKTTLLNVVSGRLPPMAGEVRLDGRPITGATPEQVCRAGIAGTFQLARIPDALDALDNVAVAAMYGRRRLDVASARAEAERLLARVGFVADPSFHADALTYFDHKRIELARALACAPELLLLDEWLAGLNPTELEAGIALVRSLNDEGLTIVMVEHVMHAIRSLCGHVVVLNAGRVIAAGTPEEALADPNVVRVYLGEAV